MTFHRHHTRLHIGKLPDDVRADDIADFMHGYGRIAQIVMKQGYAFVELENALLAGEAVKELDGRAILAKKSNLKSYVTVNFSNREKGLTSGAFPRYRTPTPTSSPSPTRARSPRAAEWYYDRRTLQEVYHTKMLEARPRRGREDDRERSRAREPSPRRLHRSPPREEDTRAIYLENKTRLHLGKLPYEAGPEDIEKFMRGYGRIVQIVPKSGYAFVELEDAKDAADAVRDLDGRPMAGRESGSIFSVKVAYAQTQKAVEYEQPTSSRHGHRRSMSPLRRPLSPGAEQWYSSFKKPESRSRMVDDREGSSRQRNNRDPSPRMSDLDFGKRSSRETVKRPAEYGHRSRSPLREPQKRRRSLTPSQGSSRKRDLPNLDAMDEVEEVEVDTPIFKLLDHKTELENMALALSLDINIRPFDGSVAFGGAITNAVSGRVVKLEPSTIGGQKPTMEKWMVFADRGQAIHVSSYQQNTLVKEHFVPKFEWDPFSAAMKGMCEKFLLGK